MTEIEKLDAVLLSLQKHHSKMLIYDKLFNALTLDYPKVEFHGDVLFILDKLKRDGYVDFRTDLLEDGGTVYMINYDGRMFNALGGYKQQIINADLQSKKVERLEISQQKLMAKLNRVTAWIAGGTLALVLVELWKLGLEHHWFSCH
jgi:hypothetical protein